MTLSVPLLELTRIRYFPAKSSKIENSERLRPNKFCGPLEWDVGEKEKYNLFISTNLLPADMHKEKFVKSNPNDIVVIYVTIVTTLVKET